MYLIIRNKKTMKFEYVGRLTYLKVERRELSGECEYWLVPTRKDKEALIRKFKNDAREWERKKLLKMLYPKIKWKGEK